MLLVFGWMYGEQGRGLSWVFRRLLAILNIVGMWENVGIL